MDKDKKEKLINWIIKYSRGKKFIHWLGGVYRAGTSLEEGIENIEKAYYDYHRYCTLDILGESAKNETKAKDYFNCYRKAIPAIAELAKQREERKADDKLSELFGDNALSSISLKISAICYIRDPKSDEALDKAVICLEELLKPAQKEGISVTIDAEKHNWSDLELNVSKKLWDKGYYNLGMVLQSRLNRTKADVAEIREHVKQYSEENRRKIRVRACIGAYHDEPEELVASTDKEVKRRLVDTIKGLFEAGVYVEIATHDKDVINEVIGYIEGEGITKDRYEFQFLKGIESGERIEAKLKKRGDKVRVYMPIETKKFSSVPYTTRRVLEDPSFIINYSKNLARKVGRFLNPFSRRQYKYKT